MGATGAAPGLASSDPVLAVTRTGDALAQPQLAVAVGHVRSAVPSNHVPGSLASTGADTEFDLALAAGLLFAGGAAVAAAGRRAHVG